MWPRNASLRQLFREWREEQLGRAFEPWLTPRTALKGLCAEQIFIERCESQADDLMCRCSGNADCESPIGRLCGEIGRA